MPTKKSTSAKATPKAYVHENTISNYFGEMVFGPKAQSNYLSKESQEAIAKAISEGHAVSRDMADAIAAGMMNWAMDLDYYPNMRLLKLS